MKRITRNIPEPGPDQQCSKCDAVKPRSEFYVKYPDTGKLFPWCKKCHKIKQTKLKPRIVDGESRTCRKCELVKLPDEFRSGRWQCKMCEAKRDAATVVAAQKRFRARHRLRLAEQAVAKYRANPILGASIARKQRNLNPQSSNLAVRKWQLANPNSRLASDHRRKARVRWNGGSWTAIEWQACKAKYDFTCLWCRRREPEVKLSPDHINPLFLGGLNIIDNIQPLCCGTKESKIGGCQYRKHAKRFDLRPYWPGPNPEYVKIADGSLFYLRVPDSFLSK